MTEDEADDKIVNVGLMLRRYILLQQMPFSGSFNLHCWSQPVAKPLLTLIDVLLKGKRFIAEEEKEDPASTRARIRVACTVSQLICSNASKQSSKALTLYQWKERETPFPDWVFMPLIDRKEQLSHYMLWAGQFCMIVWWTWVGALPELSQSGGPRMEWLCLPTPSGKYL